MKNNCYPKMKQNSRLKCPIRKKINVLALQSYLKVSSIVNYLLKHSYSAIFIGCITHMLLHKESDPYKGKQRNAFIYFRITIFTKASLRFEAD